MRDLLFKLLFWSGIGPISILMQKVTGKIPMFLFHRISNTYDRFTEPIPLEKFEKIISKIHFFYTPQKLALLENHKNSISKNTAFICFDDGLEDFYFNAFPILKKYAVPVTLFVPTSNIGTDKSIWNNQLFELALSFDAKTKVSTNKIEVEFNPNAANYYQEVMKIHKHLCENNSIEEIEEFLAQGFSNLSTKYVLDKAKLCGWDKLLELQNMGVDIQCHTHNHLYLKNKPNEMVDFEFKTSKEILEKQLNKQVSYIAYPVGGYNQQVIASAKKYFALGFSVDEKYLKMNQLGKGEYHFSLPRFNVQDQTFEEMYFRTIGFHAFISKFRKR